MKLKETEGAQSPRGRGLWKRRCQFPLGMTGRSTARGALTHCHRADEQTAQVETEHAGITLALFG